MTPIPMVHLMLIDLQRDSLISNLDGTYRFDDLPIGQYF